MNGVVQVLRKNNNGKQIVMFPFGGGSGYSYTGVAGEIDKNIEIVLVNPPGHLFNGGKPLESIEAMISLYLKELRPVLKNNCLLFGHSIGGLAAYEMCKELEKEFDIKKLIISSINPPHCTKDRVDLKSDMDMDTLILKSENLGGMPQAFKGEPEVLEKFIEGLRGDLKALEEYNTAKPTDSSGKLKTQGIILYSTGDYIVDETNLRDWELYMDCSEFIKFPGDHFYLLAPSNTKAVARILSKY
jgi:external thioesterase TEII